MWKDRGKGVERSKNPLNKAVERVFEGRSEAISTSDCRGRISLYGTAQ